MAILGAAQQALDRLLAADSPDLAAVTTAKTKVDEAQDRVKLTVAEAEIIRQNARREFEAATSAAASARETSVAPSEREVSAAKERVKAAQADLDEALREAGVTIPQHPLKYISALPASVVTAGASVGLALAEVEGPSFRLSNGSLKYHRAGSRPRGCGRSGIRTDRPTFGGWFEDR